MQVRSSRGGAGSLVVPETSRRLRSLEPVPLASSALKAAVKRSAPILPDRQAGMSYQPSNTTCAACKLIHRFWLAMQFAVRLNETGLPIRPGEPVCSFFAKSGACKFGPSCKVPAAPAHLPQTTTISLPCDALCWGRGQQLKHIYCACAVRSSGAPQLTGHGGSGGDRS